MFWKRKPTPAAPGENRIDNLANRLMKEERTDELEGELAKIDPLTLEGAEKESWYHLRGIAAFQQGNHPLAFDRFTEGLNHCPASALIRFSLGQEHGFRNETNRMFEYFDQALFPAIHASYALAEARYAYLRNRTDKGRAYIAPFLPLYLKLKILDPTFLHLRGLPLFEQVWANLAAFSQLDLDFTHLEDLTRKVEATCHDVNIDTLKAELTAHRDGNFTAMKERIRAAIGQCDAYKLPHGYHALRLTILLAQETADAQNAERLLDSVVLSEKDFPWLDDMRLLARCELAHTTGDSNRETALRQQFLARQPLLFEPDNAINFNLLRYQETLKDAYSG